MPRYAELVYNGFWFSPEREMIQKMVDESQRRVTGTVRLKLFKGAVHVVGRKSPDSLYSNSHATFEEDAVYDQHDAEGFGSCSNEGECEAVCPKGIPISNIARMKREYVKAALTTA